MPYASWSEASQTRKRLRACWRNMHYRCECPHNRMFKSYGGRGITVCVRWSLFENFVSDMGNGKRGWSIERVDNDAGYCVENCVWATPLRQARNMQRTVWVNIPEFRGCLQDACDYFGIGYCLVKARLKQGWPVNVELFRIRPRLDVRPCLDITDFRYPFA